MFIMKTDQGRERIKVRSIRSGFLPFYNSFARGNRGKQLVIPGCIFTINWITSAEKISDEEWTLIEAISDPRPSLVDPESETIIDGPLKLLQPYVVKFGRGFHTALINVTLLGEERTYWVGLHKVTDPEEQPADEGKDAPDPESLRAENMSLKEQIARLEDEVKQLEETIAMQQA